jgi:hypothetical protein
MYKIIVLLLICFCLGCKKDKPAVIESVTGFTFLEDNIFDLNGNCTDTLIPELPEFNHGYEFVDINTNLKFASFNPNNPNEIIYYRDNYNLNGVHSVMIFDRVSNTERLLIEMQLVSPPKWGKNGWILLSAGNIFKIKENGDSLEVIANGYSAEWNYDCTKIAYPVVNGNTNKYIGVVQDFASGVKDTLPFMLGSNNDWQNQSNKMVFHTSEMAYNGVNIVDMDKREKTMILDLPVGPCWINDKEFVFVGEHPVTFKNQLFVCNIVNRTVTSLGSFCSNDQIVFYNYCPLSNELITIVHHWKSLGGIKISITSQLMILNFSTHSITFFNPE